MVRSRRRERQHTVCSTSCANSRWRHIPLYFLHKNRTILVILYYFSASASPGVIRSSQHHQSPRCFFLVPVLLSFAPLVPPPSFFFCLSLLLLSVLISRHSPAHSILFALGQDKHCLCVTPKTFHRLSRFQHGPDISIIGFFLLWECFRERESMESKKKRGEEKEGGGQWRVSFHFHQDPIKMSPRSPATTLSVMFRVLCRAERSTWGSVSHKNRLNPS